MTAHRRSKFSRMRGTKLHGWGAKRNHAGSGNVGGKGNAGSGKRSDSRKPSYWGDPDYMGKHGFKTRLSPKRIISLRDLDQYASGKVDLTAEGYDKLLGSGIVTKKFDVTVAFFTKKAEKRIKNKGGTITGELIVEKVKEAKS